MCVCVCVCEREREIQRQTEMSTQYFCHFFVHLQSMYEQISNSPWVI